MSMPEKITLTCKKCGKESEFTIWRSINIIRTADISNC